MASEKTPEKAEWRFAEGDDITPDRYALKKLGGGKEYEAYVAWDRNLHAVIVAKLLRPDRTTDEGSLRRIAKEAEMLDRLAHPVILRSFGAEVESERPQLLLEHLEGPTLSRLIRKHGPLPIEQLLPLAMELCSAVHYLGHMEVVHLDIKPRNIIMGAPPRLIDMSVARSFRRAKKITGQVGTLPYMAPEQCDPTLAEIGPAADVWGIGATLYRAVTGKLPFPDEDSEDQFDDLDPEDDSERPEQYPQIDRDPTPFPKQVPEVIQELILDCLQKDPADRPTAAEVAAFLEPLLAAAPRKPVLRRPRPKLH